MSRLLSDALGANEPKFRQAIMGLERRSGHQNHDLKLTSEILQKVPQKLKELGLDPNDTTAEELYYALNHKLAEQDGLLIKRLRTLAAHDVNAEANLSDGVLSLVKSMHLEKDCFALKHSVIKKQLHLTPPKRVMKALNYRSVDSMVKLEPVPLILLAINNYESEAYVSSFYAKYKKYTPSNFEVRKLSVISPKSSRWLPILGDIHSRTGLTIVSSYELASIVLLPINNEPDPGHLTLLVANLLNEISIVYAVSSFLKLHQVTSGFGSKVHRVAENEPFIEIKLLDHNVSWKAAQHVLTSSEEAIFAPHLSLDELAPSNLMNRIGEALSDFTFWEDSESLALVKAAEATSLNIRDVASNLVNNLEFNTRKLDHFRQALMHELTKLYTTPAQIVDSLNNAPQLSSEKQLTENKAQAVY